MKKNVSELHNIEEVLQRGVEEIIDRSRLENKLKSGKQLRIKLGIDPTSQNIHLGRSIPLLKLRDFQKLGHKVILIIGDFTGLIGDTSDKDSERPMLLEKTVKENLKTYIKQTAKIINIETAEIYHNSEWLGKLGFIDIGRQADVFSLNEFISRENISRRLNEGKRVSLRELLYPLMQGYDSVKIKSDIEIGGTDQRFNLLAGRDVQRLYGQEPQDILTNPLIEGLDGRKMSSSFGNTINLFDAPDDMFGKIMSLKDDLIIKYFTLLTRVEMNNINEYKTQLENGANPRDIKIKLALQIVRMYHGEKEAKEAKKEFTRVFIEKKSPSEIPTRSLPQGKYTVIDILLKTKLASSKSEARRLIDQKGISVDGVVAYSPQEEIVLKKELIIAKGKRIFIKIIGA